MLPHLAGDRKFALLVNYWIIGDMTVTLTCFTGGTLLLDRCKIQEERTEFPCKMKGAELKWILHKQHIIFFSINPKY